MTWTTMKMSLGIKPFFLTTNF